MNKETYESIRTLCNRYNAELVVVSKYRSAEQLSEYYQSGQRLFAENRVQEMTEKRTRLPEDIRWHMIGHLQTNKVRDIIPFIEMIESVHSIKLAKEIEKQAAKIQREIPVLLQFNIAAEQSKSGFDPADWKQVAETVSSFSHLNVKGIMVIGPHTEDTEHIRSVFHEGKILLSKLQTMIPSATELSMGMSSDYTIALEEGATIIRIGSILF
ncbi:MAG: YggS family pyridoxal phosphate-dependent enzyme [Erysipelotrichaceae bacterium]|nr:YggS family pyridoxal phosphate-dependent enzyme [Erysipelotrichaceae bacterium]